MCNLFFFVTHLHLDPLAVTLISELSVALWLYAAQMRKLKLR